MKRLVLASFAQIGVSAGYEFAGLTVMAYRLVDPSIRGDLSLCMALDYVRLEIKPTMWLTLRVV